MNDTLKTIENEKGWIMNSYNIYINTVENLKMNDTLKTIENNRERLDRGHL